MTPRGGPPEKKTVNKGDIVPLRDTPLAYSFCTSDGQIKYENFPLFTIFFFFGAPLMLVFKSVKLSQSEIDRAQYAVKMSAKIWLSLLCHILRWIIQFPMHNTSAGFVLLLLDFLHIQYILSEQTDMSHHNKNNIRWKLCVLNACLIR